MKVWSKGVVSDSAVPTTSINYTMHYSQPCVWEGIRSYTQIDGSMKIFKLEEHINRLYDSAKIIGFEIPYSKEDIIKACLDLQSASGNVALYFRPIVYSTNEAESAKTQLHEINVDIYCFPLETLHKKDGIKVVISSFKRGYPQYQMQAKTPTNYNMLTLTKHETEASKADDVLLTDNEGYITEASVANIWVVKNGVAYTPPNDGSILPGITRQTVFEILNKAGIEAKEKKITRADLYIADEVFLCGTYAEIVKVNEIDSRKINNPSNISVVDRVKCDYAAKVRLNS